MSKLSRRRERNREAQRYERAQRLIAARRENVLPFTFSVVAIFICAIGYLYLTATNEDSNTLNKTIWPTLRPFDSQHYRGHLYAHFAGDAA